MKSSKLPPFLLLTKLLQKQYIDRNSDRQIRPRSIALSGMDAALGGMQNATTDNRPYPTELVCIDANGLIVGGEYHVFQWTILYCYCRDSCINRAGVT